MRTGAKVVDLLIGIINMFFGGGKKAG